MNAGKTYSDTQPLVPLPSISTLALKSVEAGLSEHGWRREQNGSWQGQRPGGRHNGEVPNT